MKTKLLLLASAMAIMSAGAMAAGPQKQADKRMQEQHKRLTEADRKVEAGRILLKWGGYVEKVHGQDRKAWAARLWPSLASADLDNLQKASRAVTYEGMRNALLGQRPYDEQIIDRMAKSGPSPSAVTKALGSLAADLVFTPIEPCRIVDTRVTVGRIAANTTRNLIASNPDGTFLGQGGSDNNCGIPANPAAVALSVTGLNNLGTGYLRVYPANGTSAQGSPVPLNSVNTTVTNDIIVAACQDCASDLKVFSTADTHYAAFVTGYFMAPTATALDCLVVENAGTIAAGSVTQRQPTACPAGYTMTGLECFSFGGNIVVRGFNAPGPGASGTTGCMWRNNHETDSGTVKASARCCRVPGR